MTAAENRRRIALLQAQASVKGDKGRHTSNSAEILYAKRLRPISLGQGKTQVPGGCRGQKFQVSK